VDVRPSHSGHIQPLNAKAPGKEKPSLSQVRSLTLSVFRAVQTTGTHSKYTISKL